MPHKTPALDKLEAVGITAICERIESGETYREIAGSLEIGVSTLCSWLGTDENAAQSVRAREYSAEAWLDKGMDTLQRALSKESGLDPSCARSIAQECARRAAIRNPQYRDKLQTEHTGANGGPIAVMLGEIAANPNSRIKV